MSENTNSTVAQQSQVQKRAFVLGRFAGTWGRVQAEFFGLFYAWGIAKPIAHLVAMDLGSILGELSKNGIDAKATLSKPDSDGFQTFKLSGKTVKTKTVPPMLLAYACQECEKLAKLGAWCEDNNGRLTVKRFSMLETPLAPDITKYLETKQEQADQNYVWSEE